MRIGATDTNKSIYYRNILQKPTFGRALTKEEQAGCAKASKDALRLLGVKNLSLILHGSSFPAADRDFYIGSFFNDKAQDVNEFVSMLGFNSIQLGPNGLISREDVSPYGGRAFSANYLFIDLNKLATREYGNILDENVLNAFKNTDRLEDETDFQKAFNAYDNLLYNAYRSMKTRARNGVKEVVQLKSEFETYKQEEGKCLETDALFDVIKSRIYDGKQSSEWNDIDKNLILYINDKSSPNHDLAVARKVELEQEYKPDVELYKFKQFIYNKQLKEFLRDTPSRMNLIGDALVGFSEADVWGNPEAFLSGYALGCPGGGPNNSHQVWDIPVIDPQKLFDEKGELLEGGKLIKRKFEKVLQDAKAIRIDHAIGLLDPWYYEKSSVRKEADGSVFTNGQNISNLPHLDPERKFSRVIEKIILPLLKEHGVDKKDVVWEDLGAQTDLFKNKYYKELKLPGIKNLKWIRAEDAPSNYWWLVGSHDDPPLSTKIDNELKYIPPEENWGRPSNEAFNPLYLAGFLYPGWTNKQREPIVLGVKNDPRERLKYKFVEMLANGKNIQISFMDLFGLKKVYNYMGTKDPRNWKLRLTPCFKEDYYKTLEEQSKDRIALNMPEILAAALKSKLSWKQVRKKSDEIEERKMNNLIAKLSHYADILYEKS